MTQNPERWTRDINVNGVSVLECPRCRKGWLESIKSVVFGPCRRCTRCWTHFPPDFA
jgi:hypothetical protein